MCKRTGSAGMALYSVNSKFSDLVDASFMTPIL